MYYIIKEAVETKETGPVYPQSQSMLSSYDYDAIDSIHQVSYYKGKSLPFTPNLKTIKVMASAKLTDILSATMLGGSGLFISEKFKSLLELFRISDHNFFQAQINHKGTTYDNYYWLHLMSDLRKFIDYKHSEFFARVSNFTYNENLHFESTEDTIEFYNKIDKFHTLQARKLVFKPDCQLDFDLFYISNFDKNIYISERLKNAILDNKITGASIVRSDII